MSNGIFERLKKLASRPKDGGSSFQKPPSKPLSPHAHTDPNNWDHGKRDHSKRPIDPFSPLFDDNDYAFTRPPAPLAPPRTPNVPQAGSGGTAIESAPRDRIYQPLFEVSGESRVPQSYPRDVQHELPNGSNMPLESLVGSYRDASPATVADAPSPRLVRNSSVTPVATVTPTGRAPLPIGWDLYYQDASHERAASASSHSGSQLTVPSMTTPTSVLTTSESERRVAYNPPSLVIIVMGLTGAGKSRFVKEATGLDVDVGHSLISATAEITPYEISFGSHYGFLIDTPGFDDTFRTDVEIFRDVADWLARQYANHDLLTSIIYVHRITDSRVAGSALRNLIVMKKMLGIESFRNLTLVTSMWDLVDLEVGEQREKELADRFWPDLLRAGARMERFGGDRRSALRVLTGMRTEAPVALTIQRELVDHGLQLDHTAAGTYLERELVKADAQSTSDIYLHAEQLNEATRRRRLPESRHNHSASGSVDQRNSLLKAYWSAGSKSLNQDQATPSQQKRDPDMYAPFEWEHDFRLVELRAGSGDSPIEVSLVMADVLNPPQFVALSYVVGRDPADTPINFRRDRWLSQLHVSQNLRTALQHLRLPDMDLLIWVDVISINQDDVDERARQVRMMSQIFRAAQGVCIWLGPATDGGDVAMDFIQSVLDFSILEDLVKDDHHHEKWLLLAKLMSRPWFRRRWVVQEIMFARDATLHCGDRVVTWADFCDAATLFRTKWSSIQRHMGEAELAELGDAHLLGAISLIEISQGVFRRDADGNVLEKLLTTEKLLSLLPMFEVTDLLDTVFAILDMANDMGGTNSVVVSYTQQPAELYRDAIKLVVRNSGSLDIICRPWAPKSGLPSWIMTIAKHTYKRRANRQQYDRQNGTSLVGMPGNTFYRACGVMRATPENTSFQVEGDQQVLTVTGQCIGEIGELGDRSINGNVPQEWMRLARWDSLDEPSPPSFWRTLVANRAFDGSTAPDWYGRACEFAFRKSTTDDVNITALIRSVLSSHVQEFLNRVLDVTWRRTFALVKDQGTVRCALCPPETEIGDIVCVLFGCSVPVILRRQVTYYQLIGECFVYGAMDGEAVSSDSSSNKTFDII